MKFISNNIEVLTVTITLEELQALQALIGPLSVDIRESLGIGPRQAVVLTLMYASIRDLLKLDKERNYNEI